MVLARLCDLGLLIDFCMVAFLIFWVCNCLGGKLLLEVAIACLDFTHQYLQLLMEAAIEFLGFTLQYFQLLLEAATIGKEHTGDFGEGFYMGKPLFYEILEKPATSCVIGICSATWFYIQKKNIGYSHVGLSYETAAVGHHWRIITSAFSHISILHLVFNMSALWSLGVVEQLGPMGLGVKFYLHYTLVLVVLSGLVVLGAYHVLISKFKIEYFRRVTAVGYSCVVFGWMTILSVKQPSSKLNLFGLLSLPISFAPFESLIFTSIIVPQASFVGHLSGIIVGYAIGWGLIHGMNNYWAVSMLGWIVVVFVLSLKHSGLFDFHFLEIESVTDPSLPSVRILASGNGRSLQISSLPVVGADVV
ncbi:hypothetical protein RHSIM_Rhsim09G0023800 [Rhododendron simsii]|uniref:Peptidase S54 rhomboid domain-containing protein n=1 Tax=Rhododendron simsii TaxID=118357 RepID=A0A834LCP9_RHOSS|nr:hypothetical protein RHSIM_Rhsim09G0023800 [Rhododendron simsii]